MSGLQSCRRPCSLLLQLSLLLTIAANGLVLHNISLGPRYVTVKENEIAVFNCSYSCKTRISNTHTTWWQIGDFRKSRGFPNKKTSKFTRKTGLKVEVRDLSNCDSKGNGQVIHQLRINASSASKWDKTPIQCVALRLNVKEIDIYSTYRLMFVEPAPKPVVATTFIATTPSPSPTSSSCHPEPVVCPSPVTIHVTHTEVTTVTEETTVTVTECVTTPTPIPDSIKTVTKETTATVTKETTVTVTECVATPTPIPDSIEAEMELY